jgi:hypothetical protein
VDHGTNCTKCNKLIEAKTNYFEVYGYDFIIELCSDCEYIDIIKETLDDVGSLLCDEYGEYLQAMCAFARCADSHSEYMSVILQKEMREEYERFYKHCTCRTEELVRKTVNINIEYDEWAF